MKLALTTKEKFEGSSDAQDLKRIQPQISTLASAANHFEVKKVFHKNILLID